MRLCWRIRLPYKPKAYNYTQSCYRWFYHRIRMCIWKQWKRVRTRYRNLRGMGVPKDLAWKAANSRRGYWFTTHTVAINMAMTRERLINSGFYDLAAAYQSVHVNYLKRCIREPYVKCCERMAVGHRLILASKYKCYESIIYINPSSFIP